MMKTLRVIIILAIAGGSLVSCSTVEKNSSTPEGAFAIAKEYDDGERFEEATRRYTEVKNKFPYSNFATKAELAIADVYYKQESFAEAQIAYQMFKELHPTVTADYVQFRIGMSFFNQLPSSIDRDLTQANDTIFNLSELIKKYPNSEFVTEAKEKRTATIKMLAEKEEYIADFYFKRKIFDSALGRYEGLFTTYKGLGFDEKAISRAAICAHKIDDTPKYEKYRKLLSSEFPGSKQDEEVLKETK